MQPTDEQLVDFPENAECRECGYALRGLPSKVCPECGTAFDPARPFTYRTPSGSNWLVRYGTPPGRVQIGLLVGTAIFMLADASSPGQSVGACMWTIGLAFLLFFIGLSWVLSLIARLLTLKHQSTHPIRNWLWVPLLMLLLLSCMAYPWPAYIRFQISKSSFEQAVANPAAGQGVTPQPVGSYLVKSIDRQTDGCVFFHIDSDFINPIGFWYIPTGTARPKYPYFIRHRLDENWYIGGEDF